MHNVQRQQALSHATQPDSSDADMRKSLLQMTAVMAEPKKPVKRATSLAKNYFTFVKVALIRGQGGEGGGG